MNNEQIITSICVSYEFNELVQSKVIEYANCVKF